MIHPIIKLAPKRTKVTIIALPQKINISLNTNYLSFVFVLLPTIFILCQFFQICNITFYLNICMSIHLIIKVTGIFNISYKNNPSILSGLYFLNSLVYCPQSIVALIKAITQPATIPIDPTTKTTPLKKSNIALILFSSLSLIFFMSTLYPTILNTTISHNRFVFVCIYNINILFEMSFFLL